MGIFGLGGFCLFDCLILFIPFEHELKTFGGSEYHDTWWGKEQVMQRVWVGF